MKKTVLIAILCILFIHETFAQTTTPKGTIKGILIDSSKNQPLAFVTVLLKDVKSGQAEKTALTKDDGGFSLWAPVGKTYQAIFAFMGYKSKTINIPTLGNGKTIDLGKILLSETSGQLQEVSIVAAKPLVKQEVDRIAYDVQADPESKEQSAFDMIRKVPLLSVDGNDNIQLKGNGNYKILINGKESAMMAKSPSDVLKSMPATNIQKIEVITTPPAKYDAEGLAGIINIITKKNGDEGYNGSVNGRMNSVYGPGVNLNLTAKKGKFGFSGYFGYYDNGTQNHGSTNTQNFFADNSILLQTNSNTYTGHGQYGDGELSFEIDTLNLITASFDLYNGNNNQSSNSLSVQSTALGATSQQYLLNNGGYSDYTGLDAGLNYELGFKKSKDQLLTLSYKFDSSPNNQFNQNDFSDTIHYNLPDYEQYNNSGNRTHTAQLDYVQPVSKQFSIEAGGKAILRNNFSDFYSENYSTAINSFVINPNQTNDFNYHQDVYSLYTSYQLKLEKWTAKAGIRVEHTQINADFTSVGSSLDNAYSNVIPSVSMQRSFKTSSITLGFTERIQRPGIYQLNPFVDETNPKFVNTGNPDLKPELSHSFELTYSNFAKNTFTMGLSYAFSNNSIQNVTNTEIQNAGTSKADTVTLSTYQNLGSNQTLGFNVNGNINVTKDFSFNLSGQIRSVWLKGTYNGQFYTNQGFVGNGYGGASYKFDNGFRLGFNGAFFTGNVNLQGRNGYGLFSSFLISKEMLKKNLLISLVTNNPWATYFDYKSYTNTPQFSQSYFNQNIYRTFALRFNYKFGKLGSDIKKNKRGINNDDTKAAGGSGK
jgi:outer membrane receptor protein involved in Fe transport